MTTTLPLPDLLHRQPRARFDPELQAELLETPWLSAELPEAGLARAAEEADEAAKTTEESPWEPAFFAEDLFVDALMDDAFQLVLDGRRYTVRKEFLRRVWGHPPTDLETLRLRQEILRELTEDEGLRGCTERLYRRLTSLLSLLKSPRSAQLDARAYRLEVMELARSVVDDMATGFGGCRSALKRLAEAGEEIRASEVYRKLAALLDWDSRMAGLTVDVTIGADGRIRDFQVRDVEENADNRFHQPLWKRWWTRLGMMVRGIPLSRREVARRLILEVYLELAPALRTLVQILGHLEVYLTSLAFRDWAAEMGLATCLADLEHGVSPQLEGLFNPLLTRQGIVPVPCRLGAGHPQATVLVTGPNSGGKTRLLQGLGIAQMLGQSGLYVPASQARLPVVQGLFASILDQEEAGQVEGRLGTELLRIRKLFEKARPGSLVLLDELCSGTNPSEAVEIFSLVLRLLERLEPIAFVSTHFLEHARRLAEDPPIPHLEFLRVEIDDRRRSTYQFVPGVSNTSLAADVARRLGVSFEELSGLIDRRAGKV